MDSRIRGDADPVRMPRRAGWLATMITLALGALLFNGSQPTSGSEAQGSISFPCLDPPSVTSVVPGDTPLNDQPSINCFAWQEFIALNWPAAPSGGGIASNAGPGDLGRPGDLDPVVWETFMDIHQIMTDDGSVPVPWGSPPTVPEACREHGGLRPLTRTSKFSITFDAPDDVPEAAPHNGPAWLADRDGNPVLYEIVVDKAEYDYIVANGLYNAQIQHARALAGEHVDLPRGELGGEVGAIELKAAWLTVRDPVDPRWNRYKLSRVLVYDEDGGACEKVTVALVGLHILHKTESNPQWVWATFEHVDNVPDQRAVEAGTVEDRYTFYDPECKVRQVPEICQSLRVPPCQPPDPPQATTSCTPNTPPAYCLEIGNAACPPYPIQVTRVYEIPNAGDNQVKQLNAAAHELIRESRSDSVWLNYQLVGVLWSGSPVDENLPNTPPATNPLDVSGIRTIPGAAPLANTTLETYVQTATCLDCHRGASIAPIYGTMTDVASDYSFVFQSAQPQLPPGSAD